MLARPLPCVTRAGAVPDGPGALEPARGVPGHAAVCVQPQRAAGAALPGAGAAAARAPGHPREPAPALCALPGHEEGRLQARRLLQGAPQDGRACERRRHTHAPGSPCTCLPRRWARMRSWLLRPPAAVGLEGRAPPRRAAPPRLPDARRRPGGRQGLLLPLCASGTCTLCEAVIVSSVLRRVSVPVLHSAAALLRMAEMPYSGTTSFFIRVLLDKKYALPYRVVDALVDHFVRFGREERTLPVVWHQALLCFVQRCAPAGGPLRSRPRPLQASPRDRSAPVAEAAASAPACIVRAQASLPSAACVQPATRQPRACWAGQVQERDPRRRQGGAAAAGKEPVPLPGDARGAARDGRLSVRLPFGVELLS